MNLSPDWKEIIKRAWSIRLMILAGVLSAAEVILPVFADVIPRGLFAGLSFLAVGGGFVARIVAQKEFSQ